MEPKGFADRGGKLRKPPFVLLAAARQERLPSEVARVYALSAKKPRNRLAAHKPVGEAETGEQAGGQQAVPATEATDEQ